MWDMKPVARSWMYVGISYLLSGKKAKAKEAFRQAVILNPNIQIQQATKEDDKIRFFNEVKKQTFLTPQGVIDVRAKPHAAVFVNGRLVGATPVRLRLRKGRNFLMLRREGYKTWGTVAEITGQTSRFSTRMQPLSAKGNWYQAGTLASQFVGKTNKVSPGVAALGAITQSRFMLLARVRFIQGGEKISIQAAAYDMVERKQIAAGGAIAAWGKGYKVVARLARALMNENSVKLGGWPPAGGGKVVSKAKGGSKVGLAVGLTLGLLALAGGGVVLGLYLSGNLVPPPCPASGSCIEVSF